MGTPNMNDIVAVRIERSSNVVMCVAPYGTFLECGDRVIVSSKASEYSFSTGVNGVCVSDAKLIDLDALSAIEHVCPDQFPLRYVKARYRLEPFALPEENKESEVANE